MNHFSKRIVALIVVLNCLFACGVFLVFWKTGKEPNTLCKCWFAFTTGELWLLAGIKNTKERNKNNEKISK